MYYINKYPVSSIGLVAINVVLFLVCTFDNGVLYNKGSMGLIYLMYDQEYYRLISSMFLHGDIHHLVNNMLLLYGIGYMIENELGHIRFLIYYLVAGLGGELFSLVHEYMTREYVSSIGASGAVYGLVGMLFVLVLMMPKQFPYLSWQRVAFVILFALYSGFQTPSVNNEAHIGGIVTGMIIAFIYCLRYQYSEKHKSGGTA